MKTIRLITAVLRSPYTYRRWVHLVLGGAVFLPVLLAVLVLASLVVQVDLQADGVWAILWVIMSVVVAAAVGGVAVCLPGVHLQQLQLARSLVGGPVAAEPLVATDDRRSRIRGGVWLALHLSLGFAVSIATMLGLTVAAQLTLSPLLADPPVILDGTLPVLDAVSAGSGRWLGPIVGAVVVLALIHLIALVGLGAARLAPVLLGPSLTGRLAAAQRQADDLTRRNHLAAELHDSIGHALSVVSLQAGAAARVMDRDPAFARGALDAIADQARTAAAELDHVLGLLREEPTATAPARSLAELPHLIEAATTTGADLQLTSTGSLESVPPVLSREAYRLCQEGITNALRHGDGGAPVTIDVHVDARQLRVQITNPTTPRRPRSRAGGGHGLAQMTERIRLLGGQLEAGEQGRTWRLVASIPLGGTA